MSPARIEAFEAPPERCQFVIGENKIGLEPDARCCRNLGHDEKEHVIAAPARDSVTYWSVEPGERVAKALVHADMRNGKPLDDEEIYALWVYMELLRTRREP